MQSSSFDLDKSFLRTVCEKQMNVGPFFLENVREKLVLSFVKTLCTRSTFIIR